MNHFNSPSEPERTIAFKAQTPPRVAEEPVESEPTPPSDKKNKQKRPNPIVKFWEMLVGKNKNRKVKAFFYSYFSSIVAAILLGSFLLYGPIGFIKETLITSAMQTLNHKYLAQWFYSEETINEVVSQHETTRPSGNTDTSQISTELGMTKKDIKITEIKRNGFKGWMMEVPDPSWVRLGIPKNFGVRGTKLQPIINDYNAIAGVNAGGFADNSGTGNGGTPVGMVIVKGEIIYNSSATFHNLIGFNEDNVLVIGRYTTAEIKALKIRDAVEFTPALIVNGESAKISGNGGWGYAPRTAIGQKKDGTVLFLVIDGRSIASAGATMKDLLEIMEEYGAYNAANLDGGSSSVMINDGEVLNNPSGSDADGQRFLPNAWLIIDPDKYSLPTDRPPLNSK